MATTFVQTTTGSGPRGNNFRPPRISEDEKNRLRRRVGQTLFPRVCEAINERDARLARTDDEEEHQRIIEDYESQVKSFKRLADEMFKEVVDLEVKRLVGGGRDPPSGVGNSSNVNMNSKRQFKPQSISRVTGKSLNSPTVSDPSPVLNRVNRAYPPPQSLADDDLDGHAEPYVGSHPSHPSIDRQQNAASLSSNVRGTPYRHSPHPSPGSAGPSRTAAYPQSSSPVSPRRNSDARLYKSGLTSTAPACGPLPGPSGRTYAAVPNSPQPQWSYDYAEGLRSHQPKVSQHPFTTQADRYYPHAGPSASQNVFAPSSPVYVEKQTSSGPPRSTRSVQSQSKSPHFAYPERFNNAYSPQFADLPPSPLTFIHLGVYVSSFTQASRRTVGQLPNTPDGTERIEASSPHLLRRRPHVGRIMDRGRPLLVH
ncbi:hypothetical protein QCA50_013709 [Cerrena zonata]|uniref:Uncharacterized protein n=1 Tax=Cerrena zonata TaxID=2478898 RepID=A0AAW0G0F2_9APHY